ncbi:MAG TPA: SurA N-terminal domain-containing protein [Burkholderiales bacterium]|nr:SurA N-terminal domain-containing protein [Burkholderiales bacterium]
MFRFVEKQKLLIQILLGGIALTFATWGIQSYTSFRGQSDTVATVNGLKITQREFDDALQRQQQRLRQMFGDRLDLDAFDTPATRHALLESMIDSRLVAAAAAKARLGVSDATLREAILGIAAFQEDGRFSKSAYEAVLRSQGMTPQGFEASMRYELTLQQVSNAVSDSAIAPRAVAARLARLLEQEREVSEALVPAQQFTAQVKLDPNAAKDYYDSHPAEFRTPEQVKAQYVVLSGEALAATQQVTEAELKQAYDANASRYKADEQRRASHILIQVAPDANEAAREAARKEAEQILAEVRKSPGSFAELANKTSQDPGSAEKGGDLGWFDRGMMVKPFADAVFALGKVGDISGVVKSDFGYHIIKLTGIQPGRTRTLDDVRKDLTAELQKQKAARAYAETAERFSDLVFEQADSLQAVAQRYKLKLQTTDWITRAADKAPPPLNNAKLINALFSDDVLVKKHNTPAVEVAPETMVAARVLEHEAASLRKFDDVKSAIEQELRRQDALKLAAKDGEAKLSKLRLGAEAGLKWGAAQQVSRREAKGLSFEALRRIVTADVSRLPAYVGADKDETGYAIYRISKVIEPEPKTDAQQAADVAQLERAEGAADYDAFVASLRKRADIQINAKNLERK